MIEEITTTSATIDYQEKLMTNMEEYFAVLTDSQRIELIGRFKNIFCLYCGRKHNLTWCQCENDE